MSAGRVPGIMKRPAGEPRQVRLDSASLELMQYFFVVKTGYVLLAHNYPQFVEFIDGEA